MITRDRDWFPQYDDDSMFHDHILLRVANQGIFIVVAANAGWKSRTVTVGCNIFKHFIRKFPPHYVCGTVPTHALFWPWYPGFSSTSAMGRPRS